MNKEQLNKLPVCVVEAAKEYGMTEDEIANTVVIELFRIYCESLGLVGYENMLWRAAIGLYKAQ